jgi:hypothetical protein
MHGSMVVDHYHHLYHRLLVYTHNNSVLHIYNINHSIHECARSNICMSPFGIAIESKRVAMISMSQQLKDKLAADKKTDASRRGGNGYGYDEAEKRPRDKKAPMKKKAKAIDTDDEDELVDDDNDDNDGNDTKERDSETKTTNGSSGSSTVVDKNAIPDVPTLSYHRMRVYNLSPSLPHLTSSGL